MTPFEAVVAADLMRDGYKVLANGWPDFCAIRRTNDRGLYLWVREEQKAENEHVSTEITS